MQQNSTGKINPRELIYFKNYLSKVSLIKNYLKNEKIPNYLKLCIHKLDDCSEIIKSLEHKINEEAPVLLSKGSVIKDNYSNELDSFRQIAYNSETILQEICEREIKLTGISSLKISYNNVFGYYLEVRNKYKDQVPENWIRKQTLVSAERYITDELKDLEVKIINAKNNILQLEYELYQKIINDLIKYLNIFQINANILAKIDCLISFTILSTENNYVSPNINTSYSIDIKNGRHPVIESIFF